MYFQQKYIAFYVLTVRIFGHTRFKIGIHSGNPETLYYRYHTGHPDAIIYYFNYLNFDAEILETKLKSEFSHDRVLNRNNNKSEWIEVDYSIFYNQLLKMIPPDKIPIIDLHAEYTNEYLKLVRRVTAKYLDEIVIEVHRKISIEYNKSNNYDDLDESTIENMVLDVLKKQKTPVTHLFNDNKLKKTTKKIMYRMAQLSNQVNYEIKNDDKLINSLENEPVTKKMYEIIMEEDKKFNNAAQQIDKKIIYKPYGELTVDAVSKNIFKNIKN